MVVISRTELMGKKVYSLDGALIGDVHDIGFAVGGSTVLLVMDSGQQIIEVPWERVSGAKDVVIVREENAATATPIAGAVNTAQTPIGSVGSTSQSPAPTTPLVQNAGSGTGLFGKFRQQAVTCPRCGQPGKWIKEYQRWYCYNCKQYL